MEEDTPPVPVMTPAEVQAEAERQLHGIGQRFGALTQDDDELLGLIQEAESWLARVDQTPHEGMHNTLQPTMAALITKKLLEHPDPIVKVTVASCLAELIRITAPEAPYDDDVMKVVFKRIVESFSELDDMNSPAFARRASILDSVAKVRCCVLMLDLDLDHLILDMFSHFFKTASTRHSEQVIQCMETIMMSVIQESDDVHAELASCLLRNLTKAAQKTLPASFGLAERVLGLCKDKLKPVFLGLLKATLLDDYSNVVALLFQDASDAVENNIDASGKNMETSKLEQDVNCVGRDGTNPSSTPTTAIGNVCAPVDNVKSSGGPASSKQKQDLPSGDEQTKISDQLISGDKEVTEPVTAENEKPSDVNSKKRYKLGSSTGSEMTEQSEVKDNESLVISEELSLETNDGDKKQPETSNRAPEDSSEPVGTKPAVAIKPKRGWPPAAKSQEKKSVGKKQGLKLDAVGDSGGRATRRLNKDDVKSLSTKADEAESTKKQHKASMNFQKEDATSGEDTDEDISLKEMVSPTKMDKLKGQQEDSGRSKRKQLQEAEEATSSKKNKMLDENLVGSRIKVWWPDDKMFYEGVVESFDASSKKHKVAYNDGDVEVLILRKEKWEFIAEEQDDTDVASDLSRGRRGKGSSGQQMKEGKTGTPQSGSDAKNPPKKRGRPKGVRSGDNTPNADSPVILPKLKGKGASKDNKDTPKTGSNAKKEGARSSRSTGKARDDVVKSSNEDESGSTDNSKDEAGSEDKNSKDELKSSEAVDGSKTNGLSTKRKPKEKEDESSEEEEKGSAKTSVRKKRRRKRRN